MVQEGEEGCGRAKEGAGGRGRVRAGAGAGEGAGEGAGAGGAAVVPAGGARARLPTKRPAAGLVGRLCSTSLSLFAPVTVAVTTLVFPYGLIPAFLAVSINMQLFILLVVQPAITELAAAVIRLGQVRDWERNEKKYGKGWFPGTRAQELQPVQIPQRPFLD